MDYSWKDLIHDLLKIGIGGVVSETETEMEDVINSVADIPTESDKKKLRCQYIFVGRYMRHGNHSNKKKC